MPKTKLPYRFVYDSLHITALKNHNPEHFASCLIKLMKISHNSRDHPREHCVISKTSMTFLLTNALNADEQGQRLLKAASDSLETPAIEQVSDEVDRTIRYAQESKSERAV